MNLVVLVGGVFIFILVAPIILFVRVGNLNKRLRRLEKKAGIISEEVEMDAMPRMAVPSTPVQAMPVPRGELPQSAPEEAEGLEWLQKFTDWLKEDWLLKLGALLLLIGFGWLATYAFLHDWIGPMGRIALGITAGTLILILGFWRIREYLHQGGIFLVLGSTTILLTIFAAREIYGFFTPASALTVMFLSTAFVTFASVKYQTKPLALAGLILAAVAPLLTDSSDPTYIGLFAYLLVIVLGCIWVAVITGWREVITASLIAIVLYSMPHLMQFSSADPGALLLFIYAFSSIFFVTHTLAFLKPKEITLADLVTALGSGLLLLAWIWIGAKEEWRSLIISAWMVVFAAGGFSVFKVSSRKEPFYIYLAVSLAMLAAATAAELEGAALTIAYTIESAAVPILAYAVLKEAKVSSLLDLLLIGPIVLSIESLDSFRWRDGILHEDFFVLLILTLCLFILGFFFLENRKTDKQISENVVGAFFVGGSLYAYALIWLSLHSWLLDEDLAVMAALVIYTIIGLICYFYGKNNNKVFLTYGGVMLAAVVARLLLIDVWQMELAGKIVTFFLIGALLVSTAFIGKKKLTV